jgi:hypothetical protein
MDTFDFEPGLLGVWNDDEEPEKPAEESQHIQERTSNDNYGNIVIGVNGINRSDICWDGNEIQWHATLGVTGFSVEDDNTVSGIIHNNKTSGQLLSSTLHQGCRDKSSLSTSHQVETAAISETTSIHDEDRSATTRSSGSSSRTPNSSSNQGSTSLHPLAIQASARCPPPSHTRESQHGSGTGSLAGSVLTEPNSLIQPPTSSADLYSVDLSQALERSNLSLTAVATQMPAHGPTPGLPATNSHLAMLANNFLLAATSPASSQSPGVPIGESYHAQNIGPSNVNAPQSFHPTQRFIAGVAATPAASGLHHTPSSTQSNTSSTNIVATSSLPPFYLFDAPIELRANFMQNQRKLGLPIERDPNSFYYGETVNGFHPQHLLKADAALNPQQASNLLQVGVDPSTFGLTAALQHHRHGHPPQHPPQMIDARHGRNGNHRNRSGQIKNEREQKRAQKITELIEQLRLQIEVDGWQVEGRSKFNTLSKCVE